MQHWTECFFTSSYQQEYYESTSNPERTQREAELIARELHLHAASDVLDLACGAGRHVLALAPLVNTIVGFDFTPDYISTARQHAAEQGCTNVEFIEGDMRKLDYQERFDAAYNYFTAWGYYSDQENLDVLERVYRALKPGGRFLIELSNREGLMRGYRPNLFTEREDGSVLLESRYFDLSTGRSHNRRVHIHADGSREELEYDHYMPSADALIRHLLDAGFSQASAIDALTGEQLTIDSWRMAVIATK